MFFRVLVDDLNTWRDMFLVLFNESNTRSDGFWVSFDVHAARCFLRMDRVARFSVHVQHKVLPVNQEFSVLNMYIYNTNKNKLKKLHFTVYSILQHYVICHACVFILIFI
jgi:hypothetical protein